WPHNCCQVSPPCSRARAPSFSPAAQRRPKSCRSQVPLAVVVSLIVVSCGRLLSIQEKIMRITCQELKITSVLDAWKNEGLRDMQGRPCTRRVYFRQTGGTRSGQGSYFERTGMHICSHFDAFPARRPASLRTDDLSRWGAGGEQGERALAGHFCALAGPGRKWGASRC